jgi:hypothetical protein
MKSPIAALAVFGTLAASTAWAQGPTQAPSSDFLQPRPFQNSSGGDSYRPPTKDPKVFPAATALPGPIPVDEIKPPTIELPDEPIEPYQLDKTHGPFMVQAKVFRGPDAQKMALVLCKELRQMGFHAYILRLKDFPLRSYIRGIPIQAPSETMTSNTKFPEKVRTFDEAAVLVGDAKTLEEQIKLWHEVKKLKPKCLEQMPTLFKWREGGGLSRALRTTNPYVPAQYLFPRTNDKLVVHMNSGLRSIANCPGSYSLQVAQFSGRTTFNPMDQMFQGKESLKSSPLRTAHDDAERMADKLAKNPEIQKLGLPVYTYHDRTSSQVFVGSFNSPNDPAYKNARQQLLQLAVPMLKSTKNPRGLDTMIVPAMVLTNAGEIKKQLQ